MAKAFKEFWFEAMLALGVALVFAGAAGAEEDSSELKGTLTYVQLSDGIWQVWQHDLSTDQSKQLTSDPGDKRNPSAGVDARITYCTTSETCFDVRPAEEPKELLSDLQPIREVVWSADGSTMAFTRLQRGVPDSAAIWLADASGGNAHALTQDAGVQQDPGWSPDGTHIVFSAGQGYGTYEIYTIATDGSDRKRLTENGVHDFMPAWSPNGARIAWTSDSTGDYEIWAMNADGSEAQQLTKSIGLDSRPAWSPDGKQIAFTTNRSGRLEIWVMDADGGNPRMLETAAGGATNPVWK